MTAYYNDHPRAGLTREQQDELRRMWNSSGLKQEAISEHFGMWRTVFERWKIYLKLEKRAPFSPSYVRGLEARVAELEKGEH